MLNLFQSIFGREKAGQRYPESLIEMAIDRALEATDPRLKALSVSKRLRLPAIHAIDHVVALVDKIATPVAAYRQNFALDSRLSAVFASADHMLEMLGSDQALGSLLKSQKAHPQAITALLLVEKIEKNILGMDLMGDSVRRDVAQVAVNFSGHRLVDPMPGEEETRKQLRRRAFDHLLTLALRGIVGRREKRSDLVRQRDLLKSKLGTLEKSGWGFEKGPNEVPEAGAPDLVGELEQIQEQINALGTDANVLEAHLDIVIDVLNSAERQLWSEPLILKLDAMNIRRGDMEEAGKTIEFTELHNAQGRRLVSMLISISPKDLPVKEDMHTIAQRYLI